MYHNKNLTIINYFETTSYFAELYFDMNPHFDCISINTCEKKICTYANKIVRRLLFIYTTDQKFSSDTFKT